MILFWEWSDRQDCLDCNCLFDTADGFLVPVARAPFTSPPKEKTMFLVYDVFAARREQHDGALDGCRLLLTLRKERGVAIQS
jgi:hypothetical protein